MIPRQNLSLLALGLVGLALTSAVQAQTSPPLTPDGSATNPAPVSPSVLLSPGEPVDPAGPLLQQALQLLQQKQLDAALVQVTAALKLEPKNPDAFQMRGTIYAEKKLWDLAGADYRAVLQMEPDNNQIKFNVAEISFLQKKYDEARPRFLALEQDPYIGDLAVYKVFLCDLLGGHDTAAAQELDALDQVGSNPSYYFGNAASCFYRHQTEEARGWLNSAAHIYDPSKFRLYAVSLFSLGYLPLPPAPPAK